MRKTRKQHEKGIIEVIESKKIVFISHIFGFYPDLKSSQFYNLKLDKSEGIKDALAKNKSKATGYLISKWIASDNPTLQIAAYRMMCSDDERQKLNQNYIEVTGKDGKDLFQQLSDEQLDNKIEELERKLNVNK